VASLLQPSCYDSIIMIKKLPYLPDIIPSSSGAYNIFVESFMMKASKKYAFYINYLRFPEQNLGKTRAQKISIVLILYDNIFRKRSR
jgi:hypothetical protein